MPAAKKKAAPAPKKAAPARTQKKPAVNKTAAAKKGAAPARNGKKASAAASDEPAAQDEPAAPAGGDPLAQLRLLLGGLTVEQRAALFADPAADVATEQSAAGGAKKQSAAGGAAKRPLLEEQPLNKGSGYRGYKDTTYGGTAPLSAGFPEKKANKDGSSSSIFEAPDVDLTPQQTKELTELGLSGGLVVFPWAMIQMGRQSGTTLDDKANGFSSYLITWAMPKSIKGKAAPDKAAPDKMTNQQFCDAILAAHKVYSVQLQKVCIRRETVNKLREHLHAAATTGYCTTRYRWKRISDWLRGQHLMYLNFQHVPFPVACGYICFGSSRKFQHDFVGEPLLHFSEGTMPETIEEICYNQVQQKKDEPMSFLEFRQFVEDEKVEDLAQLHQKTVGNIRLDLFVNDFRKTASAKLEQAKESLKLRSMRPTTLVKELFRAEERMPCLCIEGAGGAKCRDRVFKALQDWSEGVEWVGVKRDGKKLEKSKWSTGFVVLRWAQVGRTAGNAIALVGPTGTGKSMFLQLLQAALGVNWMGLPDNAGSYPLEVLGKILPHRFAWLLDENSAERMEGWLGAKIWWKSWLNIQSAPTLQLMLPSSKTFDRTEYKEKAPVMYSATYPIRLTHGSCGYRDPFKIKCENEQQDRREVVGRCEVYVDQGIDNRLPLCGCCASKYLKWCQKQCGIIRPQEMPSPLKKK